MSWIEVCAQAELQERGRMVVRVAGRQILLLSTEAGLFACVNRCPHEGYPLSEGRLAEGGILTCDWHNWKFDLARGATLVGGDLLPRFPVRVENGRVSIDVTPEDRAKRRHAILAALPQALADVDQQRLVREVARLVRFDGDPVDAVRAAIAWAGERFEFGTTHAIAGAPDWLRLHDDPAIGSDEKLAAIGEIVGHIADDVRGERIFPFHTGPSPWNEAAFQDAVERQAEDEAISLLRGALAGGHTTDDLLPAFVVAALAHYADFGHALIYVMQTAALIRRLGPEASETLLLNLTRSLIFATREDLLPEFRSYAAELAHWGKRDPQPFGAAALNSKSAKAAMAIVSGWAATHVPEQIFDVLVEANAWTLLHADEAKMRAVDAKLADNINWLDFTHALTFAEAGLRAMQLRPDLWPALLLQLACFSGRNAGYGDTSRDRYAEFAVADISGFLAARRTQLFDHGCERFIISVHLTKTLLAGTTLIERLPALAPLLAAALHRFLTARMKGRHVLRTARQMRDLVEHE